MSHIRSNPSNAPVSTLQKEALDLKQNLADKDVPGGYAGLTGLKLNLRNAADTLTSFFSTNAAAVRTWVMPNKDGTVALTSDITGTNSGVNTGDESGASIRTKLGITTLSGSNTGDQTLGSLGAEAVANKATTFDVVNDTLYPTVQATKAYADSLVAGLLDDRGSSLESSPEIVQKKLCELQAGWNGTVDTQIFSGADATAQGLAYAKYLDGSEYLFMLQTVAGTPMDASERVRIVRYKLMEDGTVSPALDWSAPLSIGHQSLSARVTSDGTVFLYSQHKAVAGTMEGDYGGKGYSRTTWNGASTTDDNVNHYQLFGVTGSSHEFQSYSSATPCVTTDGNLIVLVADDYAEAIEDTAPYMFIYDRKEVETASDPLTVKPIGYSPLQPGGPIRTPLQAVASDGRCVYVLRGLGQPLHSHLLQIFDMTGQLIREVFTDDVRAAYGKSGILNHLTLGNPNNLEPEGLTLRNGEALILLHDWWRTGSDIVSHAGKNWACTVSSSTGQVPDRVDSSWVETTKAATKGAWDSSTNYKYGTISRRSKVVYSVRPPWGEDGEEPISRAITRRVSGASVALRQNAVDVSIPEGEALLVADYSEQSEKYYKRVELTGASMRVYDPRNGSDNTKHAYLEANFNDTENLLIRARDGGLANGAGINLMGVGASTAAGQAEIYSRNGTTSTTWGLILQTDGHFRPNTPDVQNLGTQTAYKFNRVFAHSTALGPAGTTAIQTAGTGAPTAAGVASYVSAASIGSIYFQLDGAAGSRVWWKAVTGWTAII
jgi:hypothetical protein